MSKQFAKKDTYIYDLEPQLLDSLKLRYFSVSEDVDTVIQTPEPTAKTPKKDKFASELASFNQKRTLKGLPSISEDQFDELLERGSIESLSGSESESEDDSNDSLYQRISETHISEQSHNETKSFVHTKSPFIFLESLYARANKNFGLYKVLFTEKELESDPLATLRSWSKSPVSHGKSALLMIGGGHFAGAIVKHQPKNIKGNVNTKDSKEIQQVEIIVSKTFHRYTTRRKQGGSQSANDNANGKANSAGAGIRRYNEQALAKEVGELLHSWSDHFKDCHHIFFRANGSANRKLLVDNLTIEHNDPRIKSFPFTTKRATTSELKRAWVNLTYLTEVEKVKDEDKERERLLQQQELLKKSTQEKKQVVKELTESDKHSVEVTNFLKKSKAPLLVSYLKKNKLSPDFLLTPIEHYKQTPTMLHFASSHGLHHMVRVLLVNLKADPTIKSEAGRVAAELSSNVQVKRTFQTCRQSLGEEHCNWEEARVGEPKTKEEFEKEDELESERVKQEKRAQIEESLAQKTEMELKKPTFSSGGRLAGPSLISETSGLTEQQKMRLMREQRARAAEARFKKA